MKKAVTGFAGIVGVLLVIWGIITKVKEQIVISLTGSADGPTAIFLAGTLGDGFSIAMLMLGIIIITIIGLSVFLWRKKRK